MWGEMILGRLRRKILEEILGVFYISIKEIREKVYVRVFYKENGL